MYCRLPRQERDHGARVNDTGNPISTTCVRSSLNCATKGMMRRRRNMLSSCAFRCATAPPVVLMKWWMRWVSMILLARCAEIGYTMQIAMRMSPSLRTILSSRRTKFRPKNPKNNAGATSTGVKRQKPNKWKAETATNPLRIRRPMSLCRRLCQAHFASAAPEARVRRRAPLRRSQIKRLMGISANNTNGST